MANKKIDSKVVTKAFKLKVKIGSADIMKDWKPAIDEYTNYYNKLSDWVCQNLVSTTIGDLISKVDGTKPYCQYFVTENKADFPMYMLFLDKYVQGAQNLFNLYINTVNPEGYMGNLLNICRTSYRDSGYSSEVIANYRTKLSTLDAKIKSHRITRDTVLTDDLLIEQTAYEVTTKKYEKPEDWEETINYQKAKAGANQDRIYRLETLFEFWKNNKAAVDDYINKKRVDSLIQFGGCKRKGDNPSIKIYSTQIVISPMGLSNYKFEVKMRKNPITLDLLGHRALVCVDKNGNRKDLVNLEKHGKSVIFQIVKNSHKYEMYAIITFDNPFTKTVSMPQKAVGVDVNIKHMLLSTSMPSKKIDGYVNLYAEFLKSKDFTDACSKDELAMYKQIAEHPTFGVLEVESLFARTMHQLYQNDKGRFNRLNVRNAYKRELAMQNVFENLEKKYKDNHKIMFYLCSVQKLRGQYKAYFILKEAYRAEQEKYDKAVGAVTAQTNPFVNEPKAQEILAKLNNVSQTLIGCRDNIVTYAFNIIRENGYDTIALEYLESSQFEKHKSFPTALSLLKFHKLEGKKLSDWHTNWQKLDDKYKPVLDANDCIVGFELKDNGIEILKKNFFYNLIIKAVHFADVKDKFAQLSNNNSIQTAFVPSAFTSQMNSIDHKVYFIEETDSKGKTQLKLVNKKIVRIGQEKHRNGLNADYNAACNIEYFVTNPTLREFFTFGNNNKKCFNAPEFETRKAYKKGIGAKVIKTLRDTDHVRILTDAEYKNWLASSNI